MQRESFKTRIGFLLVSAGCAIGIGNVWRFPYVAGQNGGGLFVLVYLLFLFILALPVLTMELSIGRNSRKSAINAYKTLEKKKTHWHIHGYIALACNYLLMFYYTTVSGWMIAYFFKFLNGTFNNHPSSSEIFSAMLNNPLEMSIWMIIIVIFGFFVCSRGLQNGLEKNSTIMMSSLLILIIVLIVHSFLLPGIKEGIEFYLFPKLANVNILNVITNAMNQAFFTLSVGCAAMEIFGSYMSKDKTLISEGIKICMLDTFVAISSGLIIFPACFSFGVEVNAGPSLIFITLPNIFMNMKGGILWGCLFFLFMTFASFSTIIAVFENIISTGMDTFNISRKKAVVINCLIILVFSMPSILGYNILKDVHLIGSRDILDSLDYIVSNLLLPLGSIVFALFCTLKYGWGFDSYMKEANIGEGIKLKPWMKYYFMIVIPLLILFLLISGL